MVDLTLRTGSRARRTDGLLCGRLVLLACLAALLCAFLLFGQLVDPSTYQDAEYPLGTLDPAQ